MSSDSKLNDCLACRLISGFGLLGICGYIYVQSKRQMKWETYTIKLLAAAFGALGIARLADMDFMKASKNKD